MPDSNTSEQAAAIKDLITAARKTPHNFVLMKTDEGVVLEAHKTKGVNALLSLAKAKGGMPAMGCMGVMTVEGRRIDLTVADDDVPGTLPQLAKRHLRSLGVKAKIQIITPSGAIIGDGDPDEDEGSEQAPEETAEDTAEEMGPLSDALPVPPAETAKDALMARMRELVPKVKAATDAGRPSADRMVAAIKAAGAEIAGGNAARATQLMDVVEKLLAEGPGGAQSTQPQKLSDDLSALLADLRQAAAAIAALTDEERKRRLGGLAGAANTAIRSGDAAAAETAMAALRKAMAGTPVRQTGPVLPVWRDARDSVNAQLDQLEKAMRGHGMPLFARIADKGLNGVTESRLVPLQAGLFELDSSTGEARAKAAQKVRAAVGEMRSFLQSNPALPLLEKNPLQVPVTLRATLSAALDRIDQALQG